MPADRLTQLTDKQRECLRLVRDHKSSKEIALVLGISPDAVDQRLKTAVRALGVATRFEAALLFARHEGATSQRTVYDTSGIPAGGLPGIGPLSAGSDEVRRLGEDRADYEPPDARPGSSRLPLPIERGRRNDLELWQRFAWTAAIAIGAALTFGLFMMALLALAQLT